MRRWVSGLLLLCAILPALAGGRLARADEIDDAIAGFAGNFAEVEQAIGALAATDDAVAPKILEALADGRLRIGPDHSLYIEDAKGALVEARTGAAADPPGKLKPVKVNNRVRRAVEAAMGQLTLLSPDPGQRMNAADTLFRSPDPGRLPALEQALAEETDARVKALLEQARAAILLMVPETPDADKIAAVETLAARGDQAARVLLGTAAEKSSGEIAAAANAALKSIDRELAFWSGVQSVYYGLSLGSVLLLAAIGLAITFGVMGVINMAHGEMVMLGAYTTFVVQDLIRNAAPGLFDYSLLIALPLAFLVAGAAGVAIERGIIRFLYGRPLETLLATFGLSLVLQQAVRSVFGPSNREVGNPSWMSGAVDVGGLVLTYNRLWIIVFSMMVFALLILLLRKTALGLQMRAVTQNRRMAASMGIRTDAVDSLTFGLGSGVAGVAGVALSQIENVSPNLGQSYIIDSFMVVVFGGVGNLWGTLVGAVSLGIANKLLEPVAGAVLGKIAVLILLVLFIQRRPRGLFPIKGRAVET
ncbi:urea ABC transporter permease subunit UrtB [Dongia deserti]|uniref:urea ABC transporter permease subunit UrtB n=1 Tax=Dongia deserti TaxID=2268030 RepID=UPI000E65537C|nr:urea ABC transporter permease subunit UrtB [Dongia deserti]